MNRVRPPHESEVSGEKHTCAQRDGARPPTSPLPEVTRHLSPRFVRNRRWR
ncbi:hypothetical protein LX15_001290 [Streptoalloteichus tenebrarius]|uniref:Uncharacterized protein n=1 Tax=Streptoalloteichus tenebrarius (strain ATCC 17920 / DSM 40477 / JCM 4838 / CBS 697.72 / NBRC 16177 / NCIMB 11028 / NRRL B-12390 / A12253. 1 / ISP 5477) TaxID=1933 RepID=A0ABT1HQ15_STRSD|nr:hypothetical protein [Streptoalloteichus tenebrarius]MCP2257605.1 hypothetical protein [Streptoalloteichus tenebrarius]